MGDATRYAPREWGCDICGDRSLTWEVEHGICTCDFCGAVYNLKRDTPECILKPKFKKVFQAHWDEHQQSIIDMDVDVYNELLIAAGLQPVEDD